MSARLATTRIPVMLYGSYPDISTFDTKVAHLKLAYADGPIAAAIQVEDGYNSYNGSDDNNARSV